MRLFQLDMNNPNYGVNWWKYDQSHVLKTQRTEQGNYQISLSTFQCMFFSFTTIYSHQNPSSQLQTLNSQLFHHASRNLGSNKRIFLCFSYKKPAFGVNYANKLFLAKILGQLDPHPNEGMNYLER